LVGQLGTRSGEKPKVMLGDTGLLCYLLGLDVDRLAKWTR